MNRNYNSAQLNTILNSDHFDSCSDAYPDLDWPCSTICREFHECLHYLFEVNLFENPEVELEDVPTRAIRMYLNHLQDRLNPSKDDMNKIGILERILSERVESSPQIS